MAKKTIPFDTEFPFASSRQLHAEGDLKAVKQAYQEHPHMHLLEAFFLLKRKVPFNTTPNWYLAKGTKFWEKYEAWVESKGCEVRGMDHAKIAPAVSALGAFIGNSKESRAAVAIANSGLYCGFLAKGIGIETYVVSCHRKGSGTSYLECDDFNLAGKDVLIIDNDLSTGKTISRVVREVSAKKPGSLSFLFYHSPNAEDIKCKLRALGCPNSMLYEADNFAESPNALDLIDKIEKDN